MADKDQIGLMRQGGKKLGTIRDQVVKSVKPGISLKQLDDLTESLIIKAGGEPGFQLVPGYKWATCVNVNDGIVHGIPHKNIILKPKDIVSIDMGMYYQGFHTDTSITVSVSKPTSSQSHFLKAGKTSLDKAISQATAGNRIGHISRAMQQAIEGAGYSCVRTLTGHGIGSQLHQPPAVPCVLVGNIAQTSKLASGMTLAIEVIYVQGKPITKKTDDGWTIATADGKLAAVFEETIAVTKSKPQILTRA